MKLCNEREAFYYSDQERDNSKYRIFNYRLASYTDFCEPNALECRGHMFEIQGEGDTAIPVQFVSILFPKFFNYQENPFVMDIQVEDIEEISIKMDGSLISTFTLNGDVCLKSKGSLSSDQAIQASLLLDKHPKFKHEIIKIENLGYTVLMEFCSPSNRIVIGYEKPLLSVLGIRSRINGSFIYFDDLNKKEFPIISQNWTKIHKSTNMRNFLDYAKDVTDIEGFVCRLRTGQLFKIKGTKYLSLHFVKDSINHPRRLFEACVDEATDDMKSMFHDDPISIKMILEMEAFVEEKYNHLTDVTTRFYYRNKHLTRKDFAILGQQELDKLQFGAAMMLYTDRQPNFKEILKKAWKDFGLTDEVQIEPGDR